MQTCSWCIVHPVSQGIWILYILNFQSCQPGPITFLNLNLSSSGNCKIYIHTFLSSHNKPQNQFQAVKKKYSNVCGVSLRQIFDERTKNDFNNITTEISHICFSDKFFNFISFFFSKRNNELF